MTVCILMLVIPIPSYAIETCSSNHSGCMHWFFKDQNGVLEDQPSDIYIDTRTNPHGTVSWVVQDEIGSGVLGFYTFPERISGDPGFYLENCPSFSSWGFGGMGNTQYRANSDCT